jgi:hypothetical protein
MASGTSGLGHGEQGIGGRKEERFGARQEGEQIILPERRTKEQQPPFSRVTSPGSQESSPYKKAQRALIPAGRQRQKIVKDVAEGEELESNILHCKPTYARVVQ